MFRWFVVVAVEWKWLAVGQNGEWIGGIWKWSTRKESTVALDIVDTDGHRRRPRGRAGTRRRPIGQRRRPIRERRRAGHPAVRVRTELGSPSDAVEWQTKDKLNKNWSIPR